MPAKVYASTLSNLGTGRTKKVGLLTNIAKLVPTTPGFSFATPATMSAEATWLAGIKAKTILPLPTAWKIEPLPVEEVIAEGDNARKRTKRMKRRYKVTSDLPNDQHKLLQTFDNADLRFFVIDEDNNFKFELYGATARGFSSSMVTTSGQTDAIADGSMVAESAIIVDFADSREWDLYGDIITPSWNHSSIRPLTNIYLEQVGTATATLFSFRIYSNGGLDSDGVQDKIGISGFVKADITATTTAGADQTAALTGDLTDNADGTYTIIATALETGTFNTVAATAIAGDDLFDSNFGASNGEAALTIT